MNKNAVKMLMLLAYCAPYGYLAMKGDFDFGTMLFYGLMIVCLGGLLVIACKTNNTIVLILGNIISFVSSYIFILQNPFEDGSGYFKPFTPLSLLLLITIVAFVIQVLFIINFNKKQN